MAMTHEEVSTLLQRFAVEPWSTGDVNALDDLVTDDYTLQGGAAGLEDLKEAIRETRAGFLDLTVTISDVIVEDDRVAYRWTMRGTHQGGYEGLRPTGKSVNYTGITYTGTRCCAFGTERWPRTTSGPRAPRPPSNWELAPPEVLRVDPSAQLEGSRR